MQKSQKSSQRNRKEEFKLPKIVGGRLYLSNMGLTSLAMIPVDPRLKSLVISNNKITSFKTLKPQPNLEVIIARNNPIKYLTNLDKIKSLKSIDLTGTPLTNDDKFKSRILYTIGRNLNKINGEQITDTEQYFFDLWTKIHAENNKYLPEFEDNDAEDEIDTNDPEIQESLEQNRKLYTRETASKVGPFALNEAVLYDLKKYGPMPAITSSATDEELIDAIINLKKRNSGLTEYVDQNMSDSSDEE